MTLEEIKEATKDLESFITDGDLECYYKYANLIAPGTILDVGTGWAKSFIALSLSNEFNQVYSNDPGDTPIGNGWATDKEDYSKKIEVIKEFHGVTNGWFAPTGVEEVLSQFEDETIDLIHFDNWAEINNVDSTEIIDNVLKKLKPGGYFLARNYGHASRPEYTESLDKACKDLTKLETMGLITVYQK